MTSSQQHEAQSSEQRRAEPGASDGDRGGVEIRLPFLTITRGGHPVRAAGPATPTSSGGDRTGLGQLAFYGGAAALAALGVIDWPVAALVAAGTYIARKSHAAAAQPPAQADASSVAQEEKHEEEPRQTSRRARGGSRSPSATRRSGG